MTILYSKMRAQRPEVKDSKSFDLEENGIEWIDPKNTVGSDTFDTALRLKYLKKNGIGSVLQSLLLHLLYKVCILWNRSIVVLLN